MIEYLTTTLEVASRRSLDLLHSELDNWLTGLYAGRGPIHGQRLHTFGLGRRHPTPDAALRELVAAVRALSPRAKREWRAAVRRDFNIGIEGGFRPRSLALAIEPKTLVAVAALGARIVVTVYATEPARRPAAKRRKKR